jgi:hypothetical protein
MRGGHVIGTGGKEKDGGKRRNRERRLGRNEGRRSAGKGG